MRPGLLTGPSVIAVLGRDVVVRLLEISRSGCLLESSHAMPAGTIAALAIEIDGREYMDDVRVWRSQLLAGVGERYELGVEFLWLRLPREHSLRSYAATLTGNSTRPTRGSSARTEDFRRFIGLLPAEAGGFSNPFDGTANGPATDCARGVGLDPGQSPNTGEDAREAHTHSLMHSSPTPEPAGGCPVTSIVSGERDMKNLVTRFVREEEGQDLIEYSLLAALIAVACIAAMQALAVDINEIFTAIGAALDGAV
jgi:pilus assembly protein Flp/PilA